MKLYLYTNKKYNIKRSNNNDNYKVKAKCLKERRLIKMIVLGSNLLMKNQRQWMYRYVV